MYDVVDRVSGNPGRFRYTIEGGGTGYIVLERDDNPEVAGTPLNAALFASIKADIRNRLGMFGSYPEYVSEATDPTDGTVSSTEIETFLETASGCGAFYCESDEGDNAITGLPVYPCLLQFFVPTEGNAVGMVYQIGGFDVYTFVYDLSNNETRIQFNRLYTSSNLTSGEADTDDVDANNGDIYIQV